MPDTEIARKVSRPQGFEMDNHINHVAAIVVALTGVLAPIPRSAFAESPTSPGVEDWETPQTRLRPIGAASAVDAYRDDTAGSVRLSAAVGETSYVRQAVMMQADNFSMPAPSQSPSGPNSLPQQLDSSQSLGPITTPPPSSDNTPLPRPDLMPSPSGPTSPSGLSPNGPSSNGSGLTPVPRSGSSAGSSLPAGQSGDYAPLAQPRLGDRFATLGNCRNVSGPSSYRSDRIRCAPPTGYVTTVGATSSPPVYAPPPAQLGPPTILPPTYDPSLGMPMTAGPTVIPGSPGYRPLVSFGQDRFPVQVGQGILGQPVAYVPGQPVRNVIRYLTW